MTILTFNRGLSAVIGKELHADLTELRNSLPKSLPWDAAVAERVEKLSRIARTAQLRTVHKALQTISAGAQSLTTAGTESLLDATNKLLQALITHLNELVQDHKNTPLRMAKPLQTLLTQLGQQPSPVLSAELFMPFTPEDVSADRPSALPVEAFANAIRDYRAAYQSGLIKLLKENDTSQYGVLRQSLVSIEPKNPHVGYRVFFEAAIATLDILSKDNQLDNLAKWVLSKIDPELNQIVNGSSRVNDDFLSAMLHLVARADPDTSARVRKLQDQFNLKSYMADVNGIDPAIVEKFTQVLIRSREVWSQFAANEPARVAKLIAELQSKSALLKNPGFTTVINALHEVISTIAEGSVSVNGDQLSLEGAGALLILEQQLRDGSNMNSANLSASRLYSLIGNATDYVAVVSDSQTTTAILHALAAQVQDDLNQLEPRLLELLNDQRDGEQELRSGLTKISKILGIFGKDNSLARVFAFFESNLRAPSFTEEKAEVATRFTQLSTLVETLKTSDRNALAAAQKWLDAQAKVEAPTEGDQFKDMPNDAEMLEIFLEEASGILVDLERWLSQLRSDPSMHDTVVNMRRGYHTLKGSGRMVGLVRFGELSYLGELLLNNWISSKKIPSPELLDYFKKSLEAVTVHVNNFKSKGFSFVDFAEFEKEALALGGTALGDAPQAKRGGSIKLGGAPAKPVAAPAPVQAPIPAPVLVEPVFEPVFEPSPEPVLLDLPVTQPVFTLESSEPESVEFTPFSLEPQATQEPTLDFEPIQEPVQEPVLPVFEASDEPAMPALKFELPTMHTDAQEEEPVAELHFDLLSTTAQGQPLVPDLPTLKPIELVQEPVAFVLPIEKPEPAPLPTFAPEPTAQAPTPAPVVKPKTPRAAPEGWKKPDGKAAAPTTKAPMKPGQPKTGAPAKKTPPPAPAKKGFIDWLLSLFKKK